MKILQKIWQKLDLIYPDLRLVDRLKLQFVFIVQLLVMLFYLLLFELAYWFYSNVYHYFSLYNMMFGFLLIGISHLLLWNGKRAFSIHLFLFTMSISVWSDLFANLNHLPLLNTFDTIVFAYAIIMITPMLTEKTGTILHYLLHLAFFLLFIHYSIQTGKLPPESRLDYIVDNFFTLNLITLVSYFIQQMADKVENEIESKNARLKEEIEENKALNEKLLNVNQELTASNEELNATMESLEATNEELFLSQEKYTNMFQNARDAIILLDFHHFIEFNNAALRLFETDSESFIYKTLFDYLPKKQPSGKVSYDALFNILKQGIENKTQRFDWSFQTSHGKIVETELSLNSFVMNEKLYFIAIIRDVSESSERTDFSNAAMQIFNRSLEGFVVTDFYGKILMANPSFEKITGYAAKEMIGKKTKILQSDYHPKNFFKILRQQLKDKGEWNGEVWVRGKNNQVFPCLLNIAGLKNVQGETTRYLGLFYDLTDIKKQQEQITYHENYDALTDLANKNLFIERISITRSSSLNDIMAIIILGIDNFRSINDSFGYMTGDQVLRMIAKRLMSFAKPPLSISRLGSDEFALLIPNMKNKDEVSQIIKGIEDLWKNSFLLSGQEIYITMSMGISYIESSDDPNVVIQNAHTAMLRAKEKGRGVYQFFDKHANQVIKKRLSMENAMRRGLDRNEFFLLFQPKYDIHQKLLVGVETLIRWRQEDGQLVSPVDFIPLAEESGLILPIGEFVLRTAIEQAALWQHVYFTPLLISVNLSNVQLSYPSVLASIEQMLRKSSLDPYYLELEITESIFLANPTMVIKALSAWRELGVKIALDDFGTGFSSLSMLRTLPVDIVKIDRSFISEIPEDHRANALVSSIISLAHKLRLQVVAEGVENHAQLEFLLHHKCDMVQGFLLGKPLTKEEISDKLNNKLLYMDSQ